MYYRGIIVVLFGQDLVEKQLFITDERVTLNKYISNKKTQPLLADNVKCLTHVDIFNTVRVTNIKKLKIISRQGLMV